jgi:hypothetical protein
MLPAIAPHSIPAIAPHSKHVLTGAETAKQVEHILHQLRNVLRESGSSRRLRGRKVRTLESFFRQCDRDGNGTVNHDEFKQALARMDVELSERQLTLLIKFMDADNTGFIDHNEFLVGMVRREYKLQPRSRRPEVGTVHIIAARALKSADNHGDEKLGSDPYVDVYWNDRHVGVTPVVYRTCDPVFMAEFRIEVPAEGQGINTLRLEVFDFDDR